MRGFVENVLDADACINGQKKELGINEFYFSYTQSLTKGKIEKTNVTRLNLQKSKCILAYFTDFSTNFDIGPILHRH